MSRSPSFVLAFSELKQSWLDWLQMSQVAVLRRMATCTVIVLGMVIRSNVRPASRKGATLERAS
jgi:hypothetical protein